MGAGQFATLSFYPLTFGCSVAPALEIDAPKMQMVDSEKRFEFSSIADPLALLEGLFEHGPVALQIYGADGYCLRVNGAFRALFGSEPPPEYNILRDDVLARDEGLDLVRRAFAGEAVHAPPRWYDPRALRRVHVSEGHRVGIETTFIPLRGADGRVKHVVLCFEDVSVELRRQDAVKELRACQAREAAVMNGALECIITMDSDGLIECFNPAAERTFGFRSKDVIGKPLADVIIPPALREAHTEGLKRFLATGDGPIIAKRVEMTAMRAGGEEFPVELIVTTGFSEGHPTFTGFVLDLTDHRRAEEALMRSEERFRLLVEAGIIGIVTADLAGNILDANGTFLEMVGYSLEEVRAGKVRWVDMTPPEWRHLDERAIEQIRATGVATPWEKEFIKKDGSRVPILVGVAPLDGTTGECACFILDLTERKQAEAAIERLREEREEDLRASVQVRDDFLAIAGHELKTPLAALLMQLQSLRRSARRDSTTVEDRLDKAAASGLRLDRLIDQLLDLSRITNGRLRLEPEAVNLADVVHDVVSRYAGGSDETTPPIDLNCMAEVRGYWDPMRLDQLINNLVGNALKYGEGRPVEVDLHEENDEAVIRVVDHGIGIDEDHKRSIFQRFERAVTMRDFTGFGLGLWITRNIVEASGGRIEVESTLGKGSAFTVRLPTHRSEVLPLNPH